CRATGMSESSKRSLHLHCEAQSPQPAFIPWQASASFSTRETKLCRASAQQELSMTTAIRAPPARIVFTEDDIRAVCDRVTRSLKAGALTLGPAGRELEQEFARVCGVKHAIAVNSGTSALEISLRILDVAGREVIVPANTFFATAGAAVHAGARVVFADVD